MQRATVVSAPGKVLLAGGYLVLDPNYQGIVVSTSSRFYTSIRDEPSLKSFTLRVRSPQFEAATWLYSVVLEPLVEIKPFDDNISKNKFVHLALQHTIALAVEVKGLGNIQSSLSKSPDVVIVGDNDFYSQSAKLQALGLARTIDSLSNISPFSPTGVNLSEVHKTGLGSSAALITSLTCALLVHLSVISEEALSDREGHSRRLAHNLAQYVHCVAQGKVGSGFDVSAAVFGSHLYRRFHPSVVQELMNDNLTKLYPVLSPSNAGWNYAVRSFKLPPYSRLMLADVDAGSDTPSLVGQVLNWRKESADEANVLWTNLDKINQTLAGTLSLLSDLHSHDPENYKSAVRHLSSLEAIQWDANAWQPSVERPIVKAFYDVHCQSQEIRANMKDMGKKSGAPIEPDEQTSLLDICLSLAGVIGGGVPGAGGYDAIWLLVCDPENCDPDRLPLKRVEHVWSNYRSQNVCPLSSIESLARGIRIEQIDNVPGLFDVISKINMP